MHMAESIAYAYSDYRYAEYLSITSSYVNTKGDVYIRAGMYMYMLTVFDLTQPNFTLFFFWRRIGVFVVCGGK